MKRAINLLKRKVKSNKIVLRFSMYKLQIILKIWKMIQLI